MPVRQVKLPLVAHSSLSRARPGSMVGATLNEGSADRFVETFFGAGCLNFVLPDSFYGPQLGHLLNLGRVLST